jgi:HEAT repeat protein
VTRTLVVTILIAAALALSAAPCFAPYIPYTPEMLVSQSEVIALFEVVKGNVTPETVFEAPPGSPRDFDFRVRPTVTLKVVEALQGCAEGDVLEVKSPLVADQGGPARMGPRLPVFLNDGQQLLGFLCKERGELVALQAIPVKDGKLTLEFGAERLTQDGHEYTAHHEELPVADGVKAIADTVGRWNRARAYDVAHASAAQLVDSFGDSKWLNDRIIGELKSRGDAHALLACLDKGDDLTKAAIARALTDIPGPEPVPYFLHVLQTPDSELRGAAIGVLARPEGADAVPTLIEMLDERAPYSELPRYLTSVAVAMFAIDDPAGIAAVLKAAKDPRAAMVLSGTIAALAKSPNPKVDAFLLERAREPMAVWLPPDEYGDDPENRKPREREYQYEIMVAAAKALAARGNPAGADRLLEFLHQWRVGEPGLRSFGSDIAGALADLGDKRAVPVLIEVVQQGREGPDGGAGPAFGALVKLRDERAIQPLIRAIQQQRGEERAWRVRSIGEWDQPQIREFLVAELNGTDRPSLCQAGLALHKLGDPRGAERLLALLAKGLDGWDREERYWLYWALHEMKEPRAIPGLIAALDADEENRAEIADLLREMTGADLPDDPAAWRKWWEGSEK